MIKIDPFNIKIFIFAVIMVLFGIAGAIIYLQYNAPEAIIPVAVITPTEAPISAPVSNRPPNTITPSLAPEVYAKAVFAKSLVSRSNLVLEKADIVAEIPKYNLPLKNKDISNWQDFTGKLSISANAKTLLEKNGFAVTVTPTELGEAPDDFAAFYSKLQDKNLPVFITTDSLLHYYHIFFDTTLMKLERDMFYDDVWAMSKELLDEAVSQYNNSTGDIKEAAKRNAAYVSVAMELLRPKSDQIVSDETLKAEYCAPGMAKDTCKMMIEGVKKSYGEKASYKYFSNEEAAKYNFTIPDFAEVPVAKETGLITKHEGWSASPVFIYKEDYSQYVPRGHYTKSEKLKNYFKAMMWYGRMTALIKGSANLAAGESLCTGPMNGIVSEYDAKIQTLGANLIANKFLESANIKEKWQRMYAVTAFFAGFSDDLGPFEYTNVLKEAFNGQAKITSQDIEGKLPVIAKTLSDLTFNPKIYSGLGQCELFMPCPPLSDEELAALKVQAKQLLGETKGFRLMGQRFAIDSYLFSEIVSPYSGKYTGPQNPLPFTYVKTKVEGCPNGREVRGFPRGLDVMAIFGSDRAKEILVKEGDTQYSDYEKKFKVLKAEIEAMPQDKWFENLYVNWLYVLKSLNSGFGEGYQSFMQTNEWQDKELNTSLASWAELRHDTILYVKQSYTMAEMGGGGEELPIVGYVEPTPEFYARLLTLTKTMKKGLEGLMTREEMAKLEVGYGLEKFADILSRLKDISIRELKNQKLTDDDYFYIDNFGKNSAGLIALISGGTVDEDIYKSTMAADVHTEGNTLQVLEEGVGYIKTMLVAYKMPEGHIVLGAGPVFSYYEFKQPMEERLTDEAWREMLKTKKQPPVPSWTKSFSE